MRILPCPFCGCEQCEVKMVRYPGTFLSWVECLDCGVKGPVGVESNDIKVIDLWNIRKFLNGEIAVENIKFVKPTNSFYERKII